jgi:hypothetical protein
MWTDLAMQAIKMIFQGLTLTRKIQCTKLKYYWCTILFYSPHMRAKTADNAKPTENIGAVCMAHPPLRLNLREVVAAVYATIIAIIGYRNNIACLVYANDLAREETIEGTITR